jgi:hypothetical protein
LEKKKNLTPVQVTGSPRPIRWLRGTIAVCIILLMGSILLNFYFWSQGAEARIENKVLQSRFDSLLQTLPATPK